MIQALNDSISANRNLVYGFLRHLITLDRELILHTDLNDLIEDYATDEIHRPLLDSEFAQVLKQSQEAILQAPWVYLAVRPRIGVWNYIRIYVDEVQIESISAGEYLLAKEKVADANTQEQDWALRLDLSPFNREFPRMKEARSIGRGVEFLNRHLSGRMASANNPLGQLLVEFLKVHRFKGEQLMVNDRIQTQADLQQAVSNAIDFLSTESKDAEWNHVGHTLQSMGLEKGWGRTVERMIETLELLLDLGEAPDHERLSHFLSRIPMIFNVVILSPHGYFGQSNVLGKPDTGGQVIYILDQVKALEREMNERLWDQGIDCDANILVVTRLIPESDGTTSDQPTESIVGTKNASIIRIPFRNEDGEVIPHWISRFRVWPYLERFTLDTEKEVLASLGGRPDLIIGNYSDGNLVASLLSERMNVTQCNIAHALEKTKYLFSDLYWKDQEDQYHFSCQFTADLIAMNTADFIITSTYQEIVGNQNSVGQYESYSTFTMPSLYRVENGIDVFDPKFNIVSPGADSDIFFPYYDNEKRHHDLHADMDKLLFGEGDEYQYRGTIQNPDKPILFSMARMDKIKNLTGLMEWFGQSEELRNHASLIIIGGFIDPNRSSDHEEQAQIHCMHSIMDQYGLDGHVRWIGEQLDKIMVGELYRCIADKRGAFVQPALFEAFGLTVIEAMASGLPTFATRYGGPLEIIVDDQSGYHIDPNHGEEAAEKMKQFFIRCEQNPEEWKRISAGSIQRVEERYNWKLYAERLMNLSRIYGFWKHVTNLDRQETKSYLQMLYSLMYRKRVETLPMD